MQPETPNNTLKYKTAYWLTDAVFYLAILFFIIGFNFSDVMVGNWYQQYMPNIGSRSIQDIFFLDSLTGWAVTNATNQSTDTIFVLKTTNSGDNWNIQCRKIQTGGGFPGYTRIYFLNQNTGFASSVTGFEKSTNGGANWTSLYNGETFQDINVLNNDTIWLASANPLTGGVYRTTDGGASWQNQLNLGSQNPSKIYMYNSRIGFISSTAGLYKTTNSGDNWLNISNDFSFSDMFFVDSLTGWKASGFMKKTTNGGLNWINQPLPTGNFLGQGAVDFMNIDNDTIWAVGESIIVSGSPPFRGILYRTTNGGSNWLFQLPDTTIHIGAYYHGQFVNIKHGWAYYVSSGIHTSNGGDTTFLTPVEQTSSEIPTEFVLNQNYPNPFNPTTNIGFRIAKSGLTILKIFDIRGKETAVLIKEELKPGEYNTVWNASGYSSGVYFYSLIIDGVTIETKRMILLK